MFFCTGECGCVYHRARVLFVPRVRIAVNDECLPLVFASPSEPFKKNNILLHQCQLMPFLLLYTVAEISLGPLFHPFVHTQLVLYLGFRCLCVSVLNRFVNLFSP